MLEISQEFRPEFIHPKLSGERIKRILKIAAITLFVLVLIMSPIFGYISWYCHKIVHDQASGVFGISMEDMVAQHKQEWLEYHEAMELKRHMDANNLWGKPSDVLKMTIYTPEAYERAAKMHQDEVDPK